MPATKRRAKRARSARSQSSAIVPRVQRYRQRYRQDQIELIKSTVCKGASDEELKLFLWVAGKHRLDPLTRQLHAVFRNVTKHHQDEKGMWHSGTQMVIQVGIDGYRTLAARHRDYGAVDEPEYEFPEGEKRIPIKATVRLWKKGLEHPTVGVAYWDEYAPTDWSRDQAFMWKRMPRHMLAKCAEALALRKGYPELSDLYTDEEMSAHDNDFTQAGRAIHDAAGFAPSGRAVTYQAHRQGSHEAAQAVAAAKLAGKLLPPIDPEIIAPETANTQPEAPVGRLELDYTLDEMHPILRGDLGGIVQVIEQAFDAKWGTTDQWWHIPQGKAELLRQFCDQYHYQLKEVFPKQDSGVDKPKAQTAPDKAAKGAKVAPERLPSQQPAPSAETQIVAGLVQHFTEKMTKGGPTRPSQPFLNVLLKTENGDRWYSVFNRNLFDFITKCKGKSGEFVVTKTGVFFNIIGLRKLAGRDFDTDGVTPIIDKNRKAGGRTLW
jgi:phage recombination protein Bet